MVGCLTSVYAVVGDKCRIFFVKTYGKSQLSSFEENPGKYSVIRDGKSVVGYSDCSRFVKGLKVSDLFSLHSYSSIAGYIDVKRLLSCLVLHVLKGFYIVASGICISHHYDRGISASYCRGGSGLNIFFGGETGIPEVYMHVYKSGSNY